MKPIDHTFTREYVDVEVVSLNQQSKKKESNIDFTLLLFCVSGRSRLDLVDFALI